MPEQPLLLARDISRQYHNGRVQALSHVDLDVHEREHLVIMGPSGSGKSTLLHILGGIDRPTHGEVFFRGRPISGMNSLSGFRAKELGFVFQTFHLLPTLNASRNVQIPMFSSSLTARQREAKASELLASVGLQHRMHHLPKELSLGERQRVAIARSLANDASVLLVDEPTGNLDSNSAEQILDLFDSLHRSRSLTIVLVSHSDACARRATRLIRLRDGKIESDHRLGPVTAS
jgi:putative ABC transport system ATP-binding protein